MVSFFELRETRGQGSRLSGVAALAGFQLYRINGTIAVVISLVCFDSITVHRRLFPSLRNDGDKDAVVEFRIESRAPFTDKALKRLDVIAVISVSRFARIFIPILPLVRRKLAWMQARAVRATKA